MPEVACEPRSFLQGHFMPRLHRKLLTGLLAAALVTVVSVIGFPTTAEAALIHVSRPRTTTWPCPAWRSNFDVNAAGHVDIAIAPVFIQALLTTADADFAGFMLRNL